MALTIDIPLNAPFVIISGAESTLGVQTSTENILFGVVEQIFAGCLKCEVGKSVCFKRRGDTLNINVGVNNYWIVDEDDIFFTESPFL